MESSPSEYRDLGKFRSWSTLGKDIKSEGIAVPLSEKADTFFHVSFWKFLSVAVCKTANAAQTAVVTTVTEASSLSRWLTVSTVPWLAATPPSTRLRRMFVVSRRLEPPTATPTPMTPYASHRTARVCGTFSVLSFYRNLHYLSYVVNHARIYC